MEQELRAYQGDRMASRIERLERLDELRVAGAITDDEFNEQKAKVLGTSAQSVHTPNDNVYEPEAAPDRPNPFYRVKGKIERLGEQSAYRELEGLNFAEARNNCVYRRAQLEKQRRWIVGILLLIGVSQVGEFNLSFTGIIQPFLIMAAFLVVCYGYFVWVSRKIATYRYMGQRIDARISENPENLEAFKQQNEILQERFRVEREQKEVEELRNSLRAAYGAVGTYEGKGDFGMAGYARGRAAEIESKLRERGL